MHPAELAVPLHQALEVRVAALRELLAPTHWFEGDETVHQVRVAARRLRAVLDLVDPAAYPHPGACRRLLKGLVQSLGPVREQDVHAHHLRAHHLEARTPAEAATIEHLLEGVDRARAKARRNLRKALDSMRLAPLWALAARTPQASCASAPTVEAAARACLQPRVEAALRPLPTLAQTEDGPALHGARVRLKKLRYAVEALQGAFTPPPEALRDLRGLQQALGLHHDLSTLEALLWEAESGLRTRDRAILSGGVLELLGDVTEARHAAFEGFATLVRATNTGALARGLGHPAGLPTGAPIH
jgi:CHAD domain-containing protein